MEFLRIEPSDTLRWNEMWNLYEESFPLSERRRKKIISGHAPIRFSFLFVGMGGGLAYRNYLFIGSGLRIAYPEYLAVNPPLRGQGYGSTILRYLCDSVYTLILKLIR